MIHEAERLAAKFTVGDDCWEWNKPGPRGYGYVWFRGEMIPAHRAIYELAVGPIPEGHDLDHLCRVRHCVNPDHLEPVTRLENVRRGAGYGGALSDGTNHESSKTHCLRGHVFDEANTYIGPQGNRHCRACRRVRDRRRR